STSIPDSEASALRISTVSASCSSASAVSPSNSNKVLYYYQGGYCLWSKRLEKGTYANVSDGNAKTPLNSAQLQCLIDGIYWQKDKQNRRFN
ncbi:MAG: transposase, partial [Alphaproteobacteria bacterium]|nr:transposase [Alphaproteobacteria bacterium]